ncbi:MAG: hypothetical protein QM811_12895 [Pirellulales bacterium]
MTISNTLSLAGLADFELDATSPGLNTSDLVAGVTALTYGGNLKVQALAGTLARDKVGICSTSTRSAARSPTMRSSAPRATARFSPRWPPEHGNSITEPACSR